MLPTASQCTSRVFDPSPHFPTQEGHHRSHLAREIGADELLLATFYELSEHSFTQIVERSSRDSFDSHTTPSAHVSLSDALTLADMQRSTRLGARLVRPPLAPRTAARALVGSTSCAQPLKRRHAVTSEACRKDLCELVELARQHCATICLSTSAGERNRCTSRRSLGS